MANDGVNNFNAFCIFLTLQIRMMFVSQLAENCSSGMMSRRKVARKKQRKVVRAAKRAAEADRLRRSEAYRSTEKYRQLFAVSPTAFHEFLQLRESSHCANASMSCLGCVTLLMSVADIDMYCVKHRIVELRATWEKRGRYQRHEALELIALVSERARLFCQVQLLQRHQYSIMVRLGWQAEE